MGSVADLSTWNERLLRLPDPHLLQTSQWALLKQAYGWQPLPTWLEDRGLPPAAAMLLQRTATPLKLRVQYVPRGPLLDWSNAGLRARMLDYLQQQARRQGAIFIKIDPEVELGRGIPGEPGQQANPTGAEVQAELARRGWRYSGEQVQFRNSVWLDLSGGEDDWLAHMKPKTRYNLRLAERKGVRVRSVSTEELPLLYRMYAETSVRDGFVIRSQQYYLDAWSSFINTNMAEALLAEVEGEPVAGLMLFFFGQRAWYLHGMSREVHREKMPNYLLQWQAMRRARAHGCLVYDLWGAPETFDPSDSMWGVFRFKEGLGGQVVRTLGAWDYPARPALYTLYTRLLPRLMDMLRRRGRTKTQQEIAV